MPLAFLDLSFNQLSTPSIYTLLFNFNSSLVHLDLTHNHLQASPLDGFGSMIYLDISFNQPKGEIPKSFSSRFALLVLSYNLFQGSIPDCLANMTSLRILELNGNQLEGKIPNSLNNLCNLRVLKLYQNNPSNMLPKYLLACANDTCEMLGLSHNQFIGSVPELIGFSRLAMLGLGHNQLNGALPESMGWLPQLRHLDMPSNSLQGTQFL